MKAIILRNPINITKVVYAQETLSDKDEARIREAARVSGYQTIIFDVASHSTVDEIVAEIDKLDSSWV